MKNDVFADFSYDILKQPCFADEFEELFDLFERFAFKMKGVIPSA